MKIAVKVLPKKEVLDTQGRTVQESLNRRGYELQQCRVGKYIILDIPTEDVARAENEAHRMAKDILFNDLIETYELEVL